MQNPQVVLQLATKMVNVSSATPHFSRLIEYTGEDIGNALTKSTQTMRQRSQNELTTAESRRRKQTQRSTSAIELRRRQRRCNWVRIARVRCLICIELNAVQR